MQPTLQDIEAAVARVESGEAIAAVVRSSALSQSMLYKYVHMKKETGTVAIMKRGPPPLIPNNLEHDLVTWIAAMQRASWPVERFEMMLKAGQILTQHTGVSTCVGR